MAKPNPVSDLIKCFGGIRPMQTAIGEKYPNVIQNWKKSRRIPHYREDQIKRALVARQINVDWELLERLFAGQS